jgi:hypothetical protein
VEICERKAKDFGLEFADELKSTGSKTGKLEELILAQHSHEISQLNGSLAVKLAEEAFRRLATRVAKAGQLGSSPGAKKLLLEDFVETPAGATTTDAVSHVAPPPAPPSTVAAGTATATDTGTNKETLRQMLERIAPNKGSKWDLWEQHLVEEEVETPEDLRGLSADDVRDGFKISGLLKVLLIRKLGLE